MAYSQSKISTNHGVFSNSDVTDDAEIMRGSSKDFVMKRHPQRNSERFDQRVNRETKDVKLSGLFRGNASAGCCRLPGNQTAECK